MRAGRLDRLVTIQRKTDSYSEVGEPISVWADMAHREPASVTPLAGTERFGGDQFVAKEQTEFRVRYQQALSDLSPLDRIVYPAPSSPNEQDPELSVTYDVMAVHEIGRMEGLRILAARHSETT